MARPTHDGLRERCAKTSSRAGGATPYDWLIFMDDQDPSNQVSDDVLRQLSDLRRQVQELRERIDHARAEDRRRSQISFSGPDRRRMGRRATDAPAAPKS